VTVLPLGPGCSSPADEPPTEGGFTVLTYNVAGLPKDLSSSAPDRFIPLISPLLNDFDLVLVQEDFWYHDLLIADLTLPYVSEPYLEEPDLLDLGDGLNRFTRFPFGELMRVSWESCWGTLDCASDCLASKGFSYARHELARGVFVDVYNLHAEAGSCPEDLAAREAGIRLIVDTILAESEGQALIVAGDTNLHGDDPVDATPLEHLIAGPDLTDVCRELGCGDTRRIDRILFRSSDAVVLTPLTWEIPPQFVTADGTDLSDHEPVAARFHWERR